MTQRELHFRLTVLVVSVACAAYGLGYVFNEALIKDAGWLKGITIWAFTWSPLPDVVTAFLIYAIVVIVFVAGSALMVKLCILPHDKEDRAAIKAWWKAFVKEHIVDVDPTDEAYFARRYGKRDGEADRRAAWFDEYKREMRKPARRP